jgi:phosphatidylserine/phosphatidylglycerophosphate/cardiolipin synthase-like enzyme
MMRFKSAKTGGFQVFAVTGINTVSFGVSATAAARKGLLGFTVERTDPGGRTKTINGFKVFKSLIPDPNEQTRVTTRDHPVQSFVWDDFTAQDGSHYEYAFIPVKGKPGALLPLKPIVIGIDTEKLFSDLESDVFFNRGVASSQAYSREFDNKKPDQLPPDKAAKARDWLSRDLDEAILRFIDHAKKGDGLRCCFYEFRYAPVLDALKAAIDRGVDVRIIIDAKNNGQVDDDGLHASFPREDNLAFIKRAKLPMENIIRREARTSAIQHNKFMVLLSGKQQVPKETWTGSANISDGGIHGQTNVGHWLRNPEVADRFLAYWTVLSEDPGARDGDDTATVRAKNTALRAAVEAVNEVPGTVAEIADGVTPVFSPRGGKTILNLYFDLIDTAASSGFITLAFGVNKDFKTKLVEHTADSQIVFLLLEKEDAPNKTAKDPFVALNATNNVYQAFGAFLNEPAYQWARETNARKLELNQHVSYIHSKFLLRDPLGADPIVVTGSANFSNASTNDNDENMLIIRGDQRVADIYFTEFNRLFNHYYFRAVHQTTSKNGFGDVEANLFLDETDAWLQKYKPGKLKQKRLELYTGMKGFV